MKVLEDYMQSKPPQTFNQKELNNFVRDLTLSKAASDILAPWLNESNLLGPGMNIPYYRDIDYEFLPFCVQYQNCAYCCDIEGLLKQIGLNIYDANEWRLFIDSSK